MFRAVSLLIAAIFAIALLWVASEMHYGNCVRAVSVTAPARPEGNRPLTEGYFSDGGEARTRRALAGCSRLPF